MRYFLCPGNTDMRKGISSLCGVVHERMGRSVKNGDVFIFIDRRMLPATCEQKAVVTNFYV